MREINARAHAYRMSNAVRRPDEKGNENEDEEGKAMAITGAPRPLRGCMAAHSNKRGVALDAREKPACTLID